MTRSPHAGMARNLILVTIIVAVPILGGAVSGILLDGMLATTPLFILIGLAAGSLITVIGVSLLARAIMRTSRRDAGKDHTN